MLCGDTGVVVWWQAGLIAGTESAMPFGSELPAVADLDGNGIDDLVQAFYVIYAATAGDTGKPIFPPAFLPGPRHFGSGLPIAAR